MSSSTFAASALRRSLSQLCEDQGFTHLETGAVDALAHVVRTYLEGVGVRAQQLAEHAGRSRPNLVDIQSSLAQAAENLPLARGPVEGTHAGDDRDKATRSIANDVPRFPSHVRSGAPETLALSSEDEAAVERERRPHIPPWLPPFPPTFARTPRPAQGDSGRRDSTGVVRTSRQTDPALTSALVELSNELLGARSPAVDDVDSVWGGRCDEGRARRDGGSREAHEQRSASRAPKPARGEDAEPVRVLPSRDDATNTQTPEAIHTKRLRVPLGPTSPLSPSVDPPAPRPFSGKVRVDSLASLASPTSPSVPLAAHVLRPSEQVGRSFTTASSSADPESRDWSCATLLSPARDNVGTRASRQLPPLPLLDDDLDGALLPPAFGSASSTGGAGPGLSQRLPSTHAPESSLEYRHHGATSSRRSRSPSSTSSTHDRRRGDVSMARSSDSKREQDELPVKRSRDPLKGLTSPRLAPSVPPPMMPPPTSSRRVPNLRLSVAQGDSQPCARDLGLRAEDAGAVAAMRVSEGSSSSRTPDMAVLSPPPPSERRSRRLDPAPQQEPLASKRLKSESKLPRILIKR